MSWIEDDDTTQHHGPVATEPTPTPEPVAPVKAKPEPVKEGE